MALGESNAKNKIGWNDGRVRLDGKTKINCRSLSRCIYGYVARGVTKAFVIG